ncbi:MAG TPA: hypothetical protein VKR52_13875 [Terracidiphilus sp.]|nr:hypothetical protein [Terracidiphilus sp.]
MTEKQAEQVIAALVSIAASLRALTLYAQAASKHLGVEPPDLTTLLPKQ